ncbi:hypothetical protein AWJ01_05690 [Listeria monocytogenes]|nr:hypothetical protein AWJ01_05690 [Listeria monocytogenes]
MAYFIYVYFYSHLDLDFYTMLYFGYYIFIEGAVLMIKKKSKDNTKTKHSNEINKIEQSNEIYLLIHNVLFIQSKKYKA